MKNTYRNILNENRESKNINLARKYLVQIGCPQERVQEFLDTVRHDVPNSRLASCKFLQGVCRMAYEGELQDGESVLGLNRTLKYIATPAHVDEYDYNLNGLSCDEVVKRFETTAREELSSEMERSNQRQFTNETQYKIVRIPDFETASKYAKYTTWCVTQREENYSAYTCGGEGIFYFCLRNGFQNVPEKTGENAPLDEYGLSMIAVSVNDDGSCNTITCRWNHDNGGNDNIMTPEKLEDVINMPFYKTFKPRTREEILMASHETADYILGYLNDESNVREEPIEERTINGRQLLTWNGYYHEDDGLNHSVVIKRDGDGYVLDCEYSFSDPIEYLIPTNETEHGYYVVTKNTGLGRARIINPDNNSVILKMNSNHAIGPLVLGGNEFIQILDTKGMLRIYSINNFDEPIYEFQSRSTLLDDHYVQPYYRECEYYLYVPGGSRRRFNDPVKILKNDNGKLIPMFDGNTVHYTLDSQWWIIRIEFDRNVYLYKDHLSNPLEVNPVYYYYGYSPSKKSIVFADGETRAVYAYNVTNGIDMKLTKDMIPEYLDDSEYYKRHASIGLREDVSIKPFEPKDELNPKFWVNNKLNSKVRMRLLDIADDFVKTLDIRWVKPEDIVLTGSIANYNWTKFSDVDIHIIMDFKKVYKKTDFVKSYFDSKKQEWNGMHEGLKIYGFNVELSVEDTDAPAVASGVYSLEKNEWVSEPKDLSDAKLNKEYVEETAESYIEKIDDLERRIKKEKDAKKVETLSNKMVSIFNKLKGMRREGLKSKAKEMSSGNIIWKILRAEGYIKKIWDVVNYNYDKQMSLNEAVTGKDNKKGSALYVYALDKKNGEWHVLCARRKNRRDDEEGGKWNPPMGHVHRGEDMLDGAIRECFEESGIDFDDYKGKIKLMDTHKWGNNYRLVLKNDYTKDFKPGDGDEENDDFIWLPVSEISSKKWAYTCGENAVKYSPKTVYVTEEQISRMREDDTSDGGSITLYHGVSCEDLEFNLKNGGFVPRVCSDGGPKAIWLSEKQYEYSFTFKFTFPTELLGKKLIQQTTVDYTYDDFIGFNNFGCELVKTLIYQHERGFSVEINLKDTDMCKKQVRFMPEVYRKFDERMKKYPLVYKTFVKPVMDEIDVTETPEHVNEDASNRRVIFLTEEQYNKIVPGKNELYLNSWLNRFRERTRIPDLETSQLHDIMAKLKLYQVPGKIGVYKRDDVEYLLNNPDKVRGMLGKEPLFSNDNRKQKTERIPVETKPKYVGPDENDDKDDGIPPLSKMKKASFELLKKDGVFGYSKK